MNVFKYEHERASLDKYTIVEKAHTRVVYNWLQYFDPEFLKKELVDGGFELEEILGDVAGSVYDAAATEFAVVARSLPGA